MVLGAQQEGLLPPVISLPTLSGLVQKPTLSELKKILDLRHLVRCIEHIFLLPSNRQVSFRTPWLEGYEPNISESWSLNFHTAMYRVCLAGAVYCRDYQKPFFAAKEGGHSDFLGEYSRCLQGERDQDLQGDIESGLPIIDTEIEFLRNFPVYDFEAYEGSEPTFSPFVDWLLETLRISSEQSQEFLTRRFMQRQVGRFLFAFTQLCDFMHGNQIFLNQGRKYGYTRTTIGSSGREVHKARTTHVALFGVFQCEEITMPAVVKDAGRTLLRARQIGSEGLPLPDISVLLPQLFRKPGRTNQRAGCPAPHPPLQLFSCILQRGFDLRFEDEAFDITYEEQAYYQFKQEGDIFNEIDSEDFDALLAPADPPPDQSFGEID